MPAQPVLPQPAPECLNRVEPGGIGRQADNFKSGQSIHLSLHIGLAVDRPVIRHPIEPFDRRLDLIQGWIQGCHQLASHNILVQRVDLPPAGMQCPAEAPLAAILRFAYPGVNSFAG
jgi:hypothetical protein